VWRGRAFIGLGCPPLLGPRPAPAVGVQPTALNEQERAQILEVLNSDRFADKSPAQVWAVCLDEGRYLGSVSTMYRLLRAAGPVRERRAQATHPARVRPELVADGPDQVWSWDITKLKGPVRGLYYDAYVMLDIYSRKNIHWEVHSTENGELAQDFITNCIIANQGVMPGTIHSDNGTSMTSKNVAALLADLHIERSLSRPRVSNDNPYSEAAFKTLKYCPAFPGNFTSIYAARVFLSLFSSTVTLNIAIPGLDFIRRVRFMTAPGSMCETVGSSSWTPPISRTPNDSTGGLPGPRSCPPRSGSIRPRPRSNRRSSNPKSNARMSQNA